MRYFAALILSICLFSECSTLKVHEYSTHKHYVILNTSLYKIYIPFQSFIKEYDDSSDDVISAIKYIKESNENIEINPTHIVSEKDLLLVELLDIQMENLLKNKIPIFLNKETNEWENEYTLKYVQTPFGGKTLVVINEQGEELYSMPISVG